MGWDDDFNDNQRDANVWDYVTHRDGALTETNQRLEYTSPSAAPQHNSAEYVLKHDLPYSSTWDIIVDVHLDRDAFSDPQPFFAYAVGFNVENPADEDDQIWWEHLYGTNGDVWGLCVATDGVEPFWDTPAAPDANDGKLMLAWSGEHFTAYYDENDGGGFRQFRRFFVDDWGMGAGSTFTVVVGGSNDGCAIHEGGKLYLDNFHASQWPATYWQDDANSWFNADCWSSGVPTAGTDAYIENGGAAQIDSDFCPAEANAVYVGTFGTGTLSWSAGSLITNAIHVGPGGTLDVSLDGNWTWSGRLEQTGGDVLVGNEGLVLDGGGSANLSDGNCWLANLDVAATSTGSFTQSGGHVEAADAIYLGGARGSHGTYELSDGNCNAWTVWVGCEGTGEFTHTGGDLTTSELSVGDGPNSVGVYNLSGTGRVLSEWETVYIGWKGTGTFNQTGGKVEAASLSFGSSDVWKQPGGTGTYNLMGGQLRIRSIDMSDGNGTLIVDGGRLINPEEAPGPGDDPPDVGFHFEMATDGHFTFGGTNGRLHLGDSMPKGFQIDGNNTFTQTGGTVVADALSIGSSDIWKGPQRPAYTISGGELLIAEAELGMTEGDLLNIAGGGTFNLSGGKVVVQFGSVQIGGPVPVRGDLDLAELNVSAGELHVLYGTADPEMSTPSGGVIRVGSQMVKQDGNGVLNVSGGTIVAGGLLVEPTGISQWKTSANRVSMAGGRIVLTGRWGDEEMGMWWEESLIGGRLEGYGTITSVAEIVLLEGSSLAPAGGMLTIDGVLVSGSYDDWNMILETYSVMHLPVDVPAGAGLQTRGDFIGRVTNAGTLAAYGGAMRLLGEVVNTGTLANAPFSVLFVHPLSLDHTGSIEAHSEGGVSFDRPIVNQPGQTIALYGGTLYAPHITNAPGGDMTGTGTIHADVTNQGTTSFFSSVGIFGDVVNEPDANLMLSDGGLHVYGHTQNEGDIKVRNGEAVFHGGYDGDGRLDIDPALAVMGGDLNVGPDGVVRLDANSTLQLRGDFRNASTRRGDFDLAGTVQFHGAGTQELEAAGADLGTDLDGWIENFVIGELRLEPGVRVSLADAFDNRLDGDGNEAVYVDDLDLASGAWIDLDGRNLYYRNGGDPKQLFYADFDLSGDVGRSDFRVLEAHFGTHAGAGWIEGDADGDGAVNFLDYLIWKAKVGLSSGGEKTPEPATLILFAPALAVLLRRRSSGRRRRGS